MEALQTLKFLLKQQRLNFMDGWAVTEKELENEANDEDVDLLATLTSEGNVNAFDEVIHALGQNDSDDQIDFFPILAISKFFAITQYSTYACCIYLILSLQALIYSYKDTF